MTSTSPTSFDAIRLTRRRMGRRLSSRNLCRPLAGPGGDKEEGSAGAAQVLGLEVGHDLLGHGLHLVLVGGDAGCVDEGGAAVDKMVGLRRLLEGRVGLHLA